MNSISMNELVPIILEVISTDADFRLYPRGTSMLPTIVQGEDSVLLSKPKDVKVMDAVLYKRENGQYVLHRIVAEHNDTYDMCGDNQIVIEKNVPKSSVLAKVTGIYKGEKLIKSDDEKLKADIIKLYRGKKSKRFVQSVKKVLYPAYKLIFKRNKK